MVYTNDNTKYFCPRCKSPLLEFSCKLICKNCGLQIDCSDIPVFDLSSLEFPKL